MLGYQGNIYILSTEKVHCDAQLMSLDNYDDASTAVLDQSCIIRFSYFAQDE